MIELKNFQLTLGGKMILSNINAKAAEGEITVLLGENGAGKTSLLNLIAGILKPDCGELFYNSAAVKPDASPFSGILSFIQDDGGTIPLLTVEEQLKLQCYLNNLDKTETSARVEEILSRLDLEKHRNYRAEELSAGVRKKLGIALSLICDSEIYLFDEPFSSLDITASLKLLDILKMLKKRGRILIIATHSPDVLTDSIDRVWLVADGLILDETEEEKIKQILNIRSGNTNADSDIRFSWIK